MDIVMKSMALTRGTLNGLEWAINEVTDNVLNHAEAGDRGGFVQVSTQTMQKQIDFVVVDSGIGILQSMRGGHPHLTTDGEANCRSR